MADNYNLSKLFETQKILDDRIVAEHNLHGQDLLPQKILALQVELGELANELPEIFKFWSNKKNNYEKALKEFVDGLHFILSIGNELEVDLNKCQIEAYRNDTALEQFTDMFNVVYDLNDEKTDIHWAVVVDFYLGLGKMLGFTREQITDAYYTKNKINHQRQEDKY